MRPLVIVGASARAAAASARRAGFAPWCADLFADVDLRAIASHAVRCPIQNYPAALLEIIQSAPEAPWIYTGGLENHPRLIETMAQIRPLWGNDGDVLRRARSPFVIEQCLREADLPFLDVRPADAKLPAGGRWLRKPLSGSGGQGIEKGGAPPFISPKSEAAMLSAWKAFFSPGRASRPCWLRHFSPRRSFP